MLHTKSHQRLYHTTYQWHMWCSAPPGSSVHALVDDTASNRTAIQAPSATLHAVTDVQEKLLDMRR